MSQSSLYYPRYAESRLTEALADTPVGLIHGPRQSGKTTLARELGRKSGYTYFSFDDAATLEAAQSDPVGIDGSDVSVTCAESEGGGKILRHRPDVTD